VIDTLFIRLIAPAKDSDDTLADWALFNAQNSRIAGDYQQPLTTVAVQKTDKDDVQIIVLVPGEEVLQTALTIPAGQKRHLQRTLPFLAEEHLASPIEDMHLCANNIQGDQASVLAVSHSRMQQWLDLLKTHNIEPDWLLPDTAAATLCGELAIFIDNKIAIFSDQNQSTIKTELHNLSFIADRIISSFAEGQRPASATFVLNDSLDETVKAAAEALALQFEVEGIEIERETTGQLFDYNCEKLLNPLQQGRTSPLVNLLADNYRSTSKRQRKNSPKWGMLAATIALCIGLKLLFDLGSGLYLNFQSNQLDTQITALYQDLFPQDKRLVNVKVQMQNHLNTQDNNRSAAGFTQLFGQMAQALQSLDNSNGTQLQQLRYNNKNQTLLVDINVRDIQQLEQLKQIVESHNISADILSANEEQQWIKGRVRLSL